MKRNEKKLNEMIKNNRARNNYKKLEKAKNKKEENEKRKRIVIIIILILLVFFLFIINTTDILWPTRPEITKTTDKWYQERVIKVEKDAKAMNGIKYYLYCINDKKTTKKCNWKRTYTKNTKVTKSGKNYVYFRVVDKKNIKGRISKVTLVKIDNDGPEIKKVEKKETSSSAKVSIKAFNRWSKIKKYYYKLEDGKYIESKSDSYTFDNLDPNKEYKVTIKVEDEVGNIKEVTITIKTESEDKEEKVEEEKEEATPPTTKKPSTTKPTIPTKPTTPTTEEKDPVENKPAEEVKEIPEINLDKVPTTFEYGEKYDLPSYSKFGPSGGEVKCMVDGKEYKDTSELGIGKKKIECVATSNIGVSVKAEKEVEVILNTAEEISWDGWITMNLYYPEKSTNWQWRLGNESEIRQGEDSGWNDYTGPITVRLTDVENIYIRYEIEKDGEIVEVIVLPTGKMLVDIEPDKYELSTGEKTNVKITYQKDADQKQYKINDGQWKDYTGSFEVEEDTLIEARVIKKEKVYDSDGEVVGTKKNINTDSVFVKKKEIAGEVEAFSVKIKTNNNYVKEGEKASIIIDTNGSYDQKQYRINSGEWIDYTESFKVSANTLVEARIVKKQYDYSTGSAVEYKKYDYDSLYIGEADNILNVNINPVSSTIEANSTTNINITYDNNATSKKYRINNGEWIDYTNSFIVGANTLIEAEATGDNKAHGYTSTYINQKIETTPKVPTTYLDGPVISVDPESITLSTKVSVIPQEEARIIYIKIDNGKWQKYTEPIELTENKSIYAKYIREVMEKNQI